MRIYYIIDYFLFMKGQRFVRGDCSNVFDVVRGMLICDNVGELNTALGLLAACDVLLTKELRVLDGIDNNDITAAQAAGIIEQISVVRVKNRFWTPTASGWTDILIKCVGLGCVEGRSVKLYGHKETPA